MRSPRTHAALLLGLLALAGCDGGESTNPKDLPPLSADDLRQIQEEDARVRDEEQGPNYEARSKPNLAKLKSRPKAARK